MTSFPGYSSTPLRLAFLTDTCPDCSRGFTIEAYDEVTVNQANRLLSNLVDEHQRRDHPGSGEG